MGNPGGPHFVESRLTKVLVAHGEKEHLGGLEPHANLLLRQVVQSIGFDRLQKGVNRAGVQLQQSKRLDGRHRCYGGGGSGHGGPEAWSRPPKR